MGVPYEEALAKAVVAAEAAMADYEHPSNYDENFAEHHNELVRAAVRSVIDECDEADTNWQAPHYVYLNLSVQRAMPMVTALRSLGADELAMEAFGALSFRSRAAAILLALSREAS